MEMPEEKRYVCYTVNMLERAIKEYRRRVKVQDSLPTEEAVEKVMYLVSIERNAKWENRRLRGSRNREII